MRTVVTIVLGALLVLLAASNLACKSDSTSVSIGKGSVSGIVTDASAGIPLAGVTVSAKIPGNADQVKTTNAEGFYSIEFDVDSLVNVTLVYKKTGYRDTTKIVTVLSGRVESGDVVWAPISEVVPPGGSGGSGLAQTIAFLGARTPKVSVYGVGGTETSILDWEVRDSLGLTIDAAHAIDLVFSVLSGPGGGEFVSPAVVRTNSNGQVHMTFTSGVRSGVVQIVANATVPGTGRTLTSGPVRIVVVGGFPDQAHFTISTQRFNFPALGIANLRNTISVLVGDKYSNPAAPSAVYFRSSAGVMQGSVSGVITSDDGQGSAQLISGNPAPLGIYAATPPGDGYHYVVARTLGQSGAVIQDSLMLLWSGEGIISNVSPLSFDIANAGTQTFTFRVVDALGHPLAAGTKVTVTANVPPPPAPDVPQNQVMVAFGTSGSIELGDFKFGGPNITDFSFELKDGTWDINSVAGTPVTVTISVTGPNVSNSLSTTLTGVVH